MPLQLEPGATYATFRIQRVLRQHPHAWVYAVRAEGRDGLCDLKLSLDPVRDEETARRVLREVAVLGGLTNRHVLEVFDSGMGPDEHWFILGEHLEGAQLNHWHDFDVQLPATDAVRLIHHACLGLAEVHGAGIVHRGIRPDVLWVEPDGTLKILDFSSARSWGTEATGDNVTVGMLLPSAPQYAAPEQTDLGELQPTADVYSLGVILYELLAGRSPLFPGKTRSAARRDLEDDPAAWVRAHVGTPAAPLVVSGVPHKLSELVMKCLAKDPAARPQNASELANELGWILHHELGAAQAAILRSRSGDGDPRFLLVLPGSHRLASDGSLERASEAEPAAVLDWAGGTKHADIVPVKGRVVLDGKTITERTPMAPGASLVIDGTTVALSYPKS